MKTKNYFFITASFLSLFSTSCHILNINQSGYNYLTSEDKNRIIDFNENNKKENQNIVDDKLNMFKLSNNIMQHFIEKHEYIWVHSFVPSCSNLNINSIDTLIELQNSRSDIKVILLSITTNFDDLEYISGNLKNKNAQFYLLDPGIYPSNTSKAERLFFKQIRLNNKNSKFPQKSYNDFIIKNGKIILCRPYTMPFNDFLKEFHDSINAS